MKLDVPNYITVEGRQLPLIAKKHPRARSMVIRYDARKQCVKLTLPRHVSIKRGMEFAASKAGWIANQIQARTHTAFEDGAEIPFLGEQVTLQHKGGRGLVCREENCLLIPGEKEFMTRRTQDYIKQEMKKIIVTKAEYYAGVIGVSFRSLSLRDTSSHWGSCTSRGGLSFCWRLAFAPTPVLDYIVCHEVAHLLHHNHSAAYWKTVEKLCPEYETYERWLKQHGQSLWTYG